MGWKMHELDPKLQERINKSLSSADQVKRRIAEVCPAPMKKRIRQSSKPLMNKLESEFYNWIYNELSGVFDNPCLNVQSIRFKLGNGIWYKPDFVFIRPSGTWTCYEVKGPHAFRGGLENLKVASSKYPLVQWVLAWKEESRWVTQIVLP